MQAASRRIWNLDFEDPGQARIGYLRCRYLRCGGRHRALLDDRRAPPAQQHPSDHCDYCDNEDKYGNTGVNQT
jgi:hypothetical protein